MAWPPVIPPSNRSNTTAQLNAHPSDHNAISAALTDLVARVQSCTRRVAGVSLATQPGQSAIGTATVDLTGLTVTFTADATKRYRATYALVVQLSNATFGRVYLSNGSNTTLQTAVPSTGAGLYQTVMHVLEFAPGVLSGSVTLKLRADTASGTMSLNQGPAGPSLLLVDEVGTV